MRFLPALALAAAATAALTSGPARAAEACPMERATYSMAGTSRVTLHFEPDTSGQSMNSLRGSISGIPDRGEPMTFGWGNRGPASASPGGTVLAFNSDFTVAGFPGKSTDNAPYALLFPDMDGGFGIAWILTECR
ncbi:MAG: hypothetical protein ACK4OG_08155 [Parvibaculum sp.]